MLCNDTQHSIPAAKASYASINGVLLAPDRAGQMQVHMYRHPVELPFWSRPSRRSPRHRPPQQTGSLGTAAAERGILCWVAQSNARADVDARLQAALVAYRWAGWSRPQRCGQRQTRRQLRAGIGASRRL